MIKFSVKVNDIQRALALCVLAVCSLCVMAAEYQFRSLTIGNGLAGSRVNCIVKDKSGFLWFGTDAGLSRFDGFRFQNYYCSSSDVSSLRSDQINNILEDGNGQLWVQTVAGYCVYNPLTDKFAREIPEWMKNCGLKDFPDEIFIDHKHNFWMAVKGVGCYYHDFSTDKTVVFRFGKGKGCIPFGEVNGFAERGNSLVATYNSGMLVRLDADKHRVVWITHCPATTTASFQYYSTFIDSRYNYWVSNGNNKTQIYSCTAHRWYDGPRSFFASLGIKDDGHDFLIRNIQEDRQGKLWMATEHDGLYIVDLKHRWLTHLLSEKDKPNSLPDNTLENLYLDKSGAVWVGTYKNGVAYYSPSLSLYSTVPLGDICTMIQDNNGLYWCGTNDHGIVCYNPLTGGSRIYGKAQTHLGSDVVVSSLRAKDGSLWFGTFNGGLAHYQKGSFTTFMAAKGGLANNSVWALAEDGKGRIVIGTLGSGVQIYEPSTHRFLSVNSNNSVLPSDFISSVCIDKQERIVVGHSLGVSYINPKTLRVTNFKKSRHGDVFSNPMVNQLLVDSRGLLWNANMSGIDVYDPSDGRIYHLDAAPKMACALVEDKHGDIWATFARNMVRVKVSGNMDGRAFFLTRYDDLDGLQTRNFNNRSIMLDRQGSVVAGGQDGINILPMSKTMKTSSNARAIFSGVVLFDHPLGVGEKFNGRVVLDEDVNQSRLLELKSSENAFSILLASNEVVVPQKSRFLYRLKGFNDDKWLMTMESQPSVTYTNLSPGKYTLQVKVINRDGSVSSEVSEMQIVINPPLWLSWWAVLLYLAAIGGLFWLAWYFFFYRKMEQLKVQQQLNEAEHKHQLDEAKLSFFAEISHDLRTPLALVISPVKALLDKESDSAKAKSLQLIYRNAKRLLDLVNKTLDLRMIESMKELVADKEHPMSEIAIEKRANALYDDMTKEDLPKLLKQMNAKLKQGEYEVLVVDDSEDFLSFMTEELSETYKVRTAVNGKDALIKIAEHKPDIILSDVMMPEMDGNALCKAVRENPKTERIPFVMLTARLSTEARIQGMTSGADDYITKPFNFDLLNLRIYNLIKWRHATPVGEKLEPKIKQVEVTSVDERLVKQATDFVEENLDNTDLSVEMMSEKLGMSRVNLYKRLLSVTGSTPSEFIRTIRLRHAEALLREGKFNVSEVAYMVGFNNPRYFSKYFAEAYGMYPSQYKNGSERN